MGNEKGGVYRAIFSAGWAATFKRAHYHFVLSLTLPPWLIVSDNGFCLCHRPPILRNMLRNQLAESG